LALGMSQLPCIRNSIVNTPEKPNCLPQCGIA